MFSSAVAGPHGASTPHSTDAEAHGLTKGLQVDSLPKAYTYRVLGFPAKKKQKKQFVRQFSEDHYVKKKQFPFCIHFILAPLWKLKPSCPFTCK